MRPSGSAIYYLLKADERSHWHRIDATETWHLYVGAPLSLGLFDRRGTQEVSLGPDLERGEVPQLAVPRWCWKSAERHGEWSLVGCTVRPASRFEGLELAALDWEPEHSSGIWKSGISGVIVENRECDQGIAKCWQKLQLREFGDRHPANFIGLPVERRSIESLWWDVQ